MGQIVRKSILESKYYVFNPSNNYIEILKPDLKLSDYILVVNSTANKIIFNPFCDGLGGSVNSAGNLVFEYDTSSMAATDELIIYIHDNFETIGVDGDEIKVHVAHNELLSDILNQLKIMNLYFTQLVDVEFDETNIT